MMKATVRKQGSRTEVEDKHATFAIEGRGEALRGRVLVMGKEMTVTVEIPVEDLVTMRAVLDKHLGGKAG